MIPHGCEGDQYQRNKRECLIDKTWRTVHRSVHDVRYDMASKYHNTFHSSYKDKSPKSTMAVKQQDGTLTDERGLRDEILELKRQILILKKTNEQNAVKFRKYEDEAKRKDRQIEQLMDPSKNTDIRKILSTKGAALLMSLKDQNNSLIQMILDKDLHIKRLIGEIKMSKLYASTRKTEPYKNEITRLRNLLVRSQETLREATEAPPTRSVCVGGTPVLEVTTSSSQSSPRELEELRFTIQSLETHMKYSNELLSKKNQEIMILNEQLNTTKKCRKCNKIILNDDLQAKNHDWFLSDELNTHTIHEHDLGTRRKRSSCVELLDLFERMTKPEQQDTLKMPKSAPPAMEGQSGRLMFRPGSAPLTPEERSDRTKLLQDLEEIEKTLSRFDADTVLNATRSKNKSLFHNIAIEQIDEATQQQQQQQQQQQSERSDEWKLKKNNLKRNDLSCYKKKNIELMATKTGRQVKEKKRKQGAVHKEKSRTEKAKISEKGSEDNSEVETLETYEFEMMEKKIENDQIEMENLIKSMELSKEDEGDKEESSQSSSPSKASLLRRQDNVAQSVDTVEGDSEVDGETVEESPPVHVPSRRSSTSSTNEAKTTTSSRKSATSEDVQSNEQHNEETRVDAPRPSQDMQQVTGQQSSVPPVPFKRTVITTSVSEETAQTRIETPVPTPAARRQSLPSMALATKSTTPTYARVEDEVVVTETDTQSIKEEITSISSRYSPDIQKELQCLYENITTFEEAERKSRLREVYKQSMDSSFESENSLTARQEAKVVEVQVEINQEAESSSTPNEEAPGQGKQARRMDWGGSFIMEDEDDSDVIIGHVP